MYNASSDHSTLPCIKAGERHIICLDELNLGGQNILGFSAGSKILAAKISVGDPANITPGFSAESKIPVAKISAGTLAGILPGSRQDPAGILSGKRECLRPKSWRDLVGILPGSHQDPAKIPVAFLQGDAL